MTTVLVTNDDGYTSAGYLPLVQELSKKYSVVPVVPDCGKSWVSKAITTKKNLKVKTVKREGIKLFLLDGTPADCTQIGLYHLSPTPPDLVVSGINIGLNIGHARILSSGTIGAAMEASIEGVRAIASSISVPLSIRESIDFYSPTSYSLFEQAAKITTKIAGIVLQNTFPPDTDLFSVNIPFNATVDTDIEITEPFKKPYGQLFYKTGNRYTHRTPPIEFKNMPEKTDLQTLYKEKISITPICLSLINPNSLEPVGIIFHDKW
jgi:5'-nucleotidase